jgi:flavin-binding protein dodecin
VELLFQRITSRRVMNDLQISSATALDPALPVAASVPVPVEFVGSSDHTIGEAVRRALSRASITLRTLDGAGVVVIPQIARNGGGPRFNVTLRVSPASTAPEP